jgi:ribosomal protein L22
MAQLTFSLKRRADAVRYAVNRAVRRAEDRLNLFSEDLIVHECTAEIQSQDPRVRFHSRGRFGLAHHRFSRVRVVLREAFPEEKEGLVKFSRAKAKPVTAEMRNPRHY